MQTDGYGGYDYLDHIKGVEHSGCLAHARRKFTDAQKARGKNANPGSIDIALKYIREIYVVESNARKKHLSGADLLEFRQQHAKPVLDDFF